MPTITPVKIAGLDSWRREAMRVVLAMSTAAGTVYTSVRSALSSHDSRISELEAKENINEQRLVPRQELDAHWTAISTQLSQIEQDLRDIRRDQIHLHR